MRAFRAAEQLSAVLATEALPAQARALGERVVARLSSPVRVAVVGVSGAGKRRVVEGLLGGAVLPAIAGMPPAEIGLGDGERIGIVGGDGAEREVDVIEFAGLDPAELALMRLSAPLPLLEKIRFLVVPLEGGPAERRAALRWTFRKADMLLWCVRRLDAPDRDLWHLMPQALRDHAVLAVTGAGPVRASEADRALAAECFSETRILPDGCDGQERVARLRTALLAHTSRARREDLEGALIFLDHHLSQQARGAACGPAMGEARADGPAEADVLSRQGEPEPRAPKEMAGHIAALLADRGAGLADLCGTDAPGGAGAAQALDLCAGALEECADLARQEGGALADLVDEASELMVLLQLEASPAALSDGVALLLQLRRECEAALAA